MLTKIEWSKLESLVCVFFEFAFANLWVFFHVFLVLYFELFMP